MIDTKHYNIKKMQLMCTYGIMLQPRGYGQETARLHKVCREEVRKVNACNECALYTQCSKGLIKAPRFAFYLYRLKYKTLPQIKVNLANVGGFASLRLCPVAPTIDEMNKGAFATIRAYRKNGGLKLIFKLLLQGTEDDESIQNRLLAAYERTKKDERKIK